MVDRAAHERFVAALEVQIPPSAGNALGFDRLVPLALGEPEIPRVMALPGGCRLSGAMANQGFALIPTDAFAGMSVGRSTKTGPIPSSFRGPLTLLASATT